MSELVEKVESLIASQSPRTFEDWVQQREGSDQDAINEALTRKLLLGSSVESMKVEA